MIKPIGLEEFVAVEAVPGPVAARTVAQLTDPLKRRLIWFLQWQSHQEGGLKKFAHQLLWPCGNSRLGSPTMHRLGFNARTYFQGDDFEKICDELSYYPLQKLEHLKALLEAHVDMWDLILDETPARREWMAENAAKCFKERQATLEKMRPERRRVAAATFLYVCREKALQFPAHLASLCSDPKASWHLNHFRDLTGALEEALNAQGVLAKQLAAETEIAGKVQHALSFAHRNKSLVVIKGTERIGKSAAARKWVFANPDKARLVSLTADTTNLLFYGEIFDALGCGEKKTGNSSELRSAIKATVKNCDVTLIFDEAHTLFGLSQKASIKRLEYIRTEFVNRGIPVVLIITPQFAARLSELEQKTTFNVNQFRGRVARWAELPARPSRKDIECLCEFCLPGAPAAYHALLTSFGLESEYPFAAVKNAIIEARELLASSNATELDADFLKKAIGFALFTNSQLAATLPAQAPHPRHGRRGATVPNVPAIPSEPALQGSSTPVAARSQRPCIATAEPDFSTSTNLSSRTRHALTV